MYHVDWIIGDEVDITGDIRCVFMSQPVGPHLQIFELCYWVVMFTFPFWGYFSPLSLYLSWILIVYFIPSA